MTAFTVGSVLAANPRGGLIALSHGIASQMALNAQCGGGVATQGLSAVASKLQDAPDLAAIESARLPVNVHRLQERLKQTRFLWACGAGGTMRLSIGQKLEPLLQTYGIAGAAWVLTGVIFAFDVYTRPEYVSATYAYLLPVLINNFASRPHPFILASAASLLALLAAIPIPPDHWPRASVLASRIIGVGTVWLGALLVSMQIRRRQQLQRDLERQQRFFDILSHEIRNALTAVGGHAQRLMKLADKLEPADVALRAEKIRSAAGRIEAIVSRVQFASALGNGMVPLSREDVDLNALVSQLIERLRDEHTGRLIDLELSPKTLRTVGDEVLLRHAIENIVLNSLQYSPLGSRILVHTNGLAGVSRITIADLGPGMTTEEILRVREPYFRGTSSQGKAGTGLGLYFADRIVHGHKGSLKIESRVGKGTTVTVEVPHNDAVTP